MNGPTSIHEELAHWQNPIHAYCASSISAWMRQVHDLKAQLGASQAEIRRLRTGEPMEERCCLLECDKPAAYYVQAQGAPYDDFTMTCTDHLPEMLAPEVSVVWPVEMGTPGGGAIERALHA